MTITHDTQEQTLRKDNLNTLVDKIEVWGKPKGLLENSKKLAQLGKLLEESGELASGILKDDIELQKDSLGDIFVVLTLLTAQLGFNLQDCVELAYNEIKDRKGKTSTDGSFIKE
jgi:NTP pyrophosphatase (non-canonical NTP hydrolase)